MPDPATTPAVEGIRIAPLAVSFSDKAMLPVEPGQAVGKGWPKRRLRTRSALSPVTRHSTRF
jgi:hypothetical protein